MFLFSVLYLSYILALLPICNCVCFVFFCFFCSTSVGERTGHWWREEGPIKIRKKKKNRMQAEAALNANSSSNEVDYSKTLIENATADVLVSIPSAQSKAKEVQTHTHK